MLVALFGFMILMIKLFPAIPMSKSLHRWLVEWPLELGSRLERKHVFMLLILLLAGQSLALMGGTELALAYAADMSIYADAVLVTYLATMAVRLKSVLQAFSGIVAQVFIGISRPRPRSRRTRSAVPRHENPSNDDDPVWIPVKRAA